MSDAPRQNPQDPQDPNAHRLMDHNYDGIQEYDNPLPGWWTWIFWATIVFSALYVLNVPGIGIGHGRIANYEAEMSKARAHVPAAPPAAAPLGDSDLMAMAHDPTHLALGRTTFETTCSPCHRMDGGGNIGPNLTDDFWLHGGRPSEILATVTNGVPDKGMPSWGQMLKPEQIPAVVAYVITLRGTRPANPKAPQGVRIEAGTAKPQ